MKDKNLQYGENLPQKDMNMGKVNNDIKYFINNQYKEQTREI